jgi:uncharacterized protein (TIGR02996 family)
MSVYFVYRCHYMGPSEKYLKKFDDDSVLKWYQARRGRLGGTDCDTVSRMVEREMGCRIYSFFDLFWLRAEEEGEKELPSPTNAAELAGLVQRVYNDEVICQSEHCVQVYTDDDELEMAWYLFDDHFLKKHGELAAFLLHDDWKLPAGEGQKPGRPSEKTTRLVQAKHGEGATYAVFLGFYNSSDNLDCLGPAQRIDGVRLPELARYLACNPLNDNWPGEFQDIRAVLTTEGKGTSPLEKVFLADIRARPDDEVNWNAYSDWLMEQGSKPAGLRLLEGALTRLGASSDIKIPDGVDLYELMGESIQTAEAAARPYVKALDRCRKKYRSLVHVDDHVAQLCLFMRNDAFKKCPLYHQWIFFDDLWVGAHPALANAILRFAARWDVLTV